MSNRRRYPLTGTNELESRVVLSHSGLRNPSVLVAGLHPHARSLASASPSIVALTNQAFDSFVQDFSQARATYLSSVSTNSMPAFKNYTQYRVQLLAEQIVSSILTSKLSNAGQHGRGASLPGLIDRKIGGLNGTAFSAGSLGKALTDAIPNVNDAATMALDSLAQDQAIQSARVGVLNGVSIIKNGDFGNQPGH